MAEMIDKYKNNTVNRETNMDDKYNDESSRILLETREKLNNDCEYISNVLATGKQHNLFKKSPFNVDDLMNLS